MYRLMFAGLMMVSLCFVSPARADEEHEHEHLDLSPSLVGGQIVSNGWSDAEGEFHPDERVFGYEFGEDEGDPFFAGDPGFNVRPGSGFNEGSQMGFHLLATLLYWDGADEGNIVFTAPAAGTSITYNFGNPSLDRVVTDATFDAADRFLGSLIDGSGSTHFHINSFIAGPGGDDPADGIYLVQMAILNSQVASLSEPVWIVYNLGLDENLHGAAMEYVETTFVPEPAALMLLAIGGAAALLRRRAA